VSENWAETHQSCRLAPDWNAYRPSPWVLVQFRRSAPKSLVAVEAIPCIMAKLGSQDGDPGSIRRRILMFDRRILTCVALMAALWLFQTGVARAAVIGFYTLNGNANDSSGNGNNGTIHGSVTFTNNAPFGGSALTLDGTSRSNFVSVPIDSTVSGQPTETFGAWFFVPTGASTSSIRGLISNDDGDFDRTLDEDTRNGGFQDSVFIGGSVVGGGSVATNQWVFVAASYNNSGGNNGSYIFQVGANQFTGSTSFDGNSVAGTTYLGINPNFDLQFQGEIADAFFYNTALTASQLTAIEEGGPSAILGTSTPEPASFSLLGVGLFLLTAAARRRARLRNAKS
jgi:hypothetical protein